ncbi:CRT transporter 2 [Perilla frutescens var. frutescens]|nr:CRT transporter 2 [Perilla frutescens var. frutescens]
MMRSFSAKSSAACSVSATINGGAALTPTPTPTPAPLRLPLHPSKPSLKKLQLSIFHNKYVYYERQAIVDAARFRHLVPSALSKAPSLDGSPPLSSISDDRNLAVVAWSVVTLLIAVANRVLQKLALVPMKDYPFFLAQLNSFAFVGVFFSVLHMRYHGGKTTDEMLGVPKLPFVVIGLLEFLSSVCGMYAGAMLPGPAIPLLYQVID